jgi:hypothetical protein
MAVAVLADWGALAGDFPAFSSARAITSGPKDHLFAS